MIEGVCGGGCGVEGGLLETGVSFLGSGKSTEKVRLSMSENIVCLVVDAKGSGKMVLPITVFQRIDVSTQVEELSGVVS